MSWREYWNQDTPIYSGERHKLLHYRLVSNDIVALLPSANAQVLDYGCGEALFAERVARQCSHLYLCDGAPLVRDRLVERFGANGRITVLAPEQLDHIEDGSLDLIVVNSLLQYLSLEDLRGLLAIWRGKLSPDGRLILADIIPHDVSPITDARALLSLAWQGGFLKSALLGLGRTAFSEYRKIREEIGLSHYAEDEIEELLRDAGFVPRRLERNMGHNQARMTYEARLAAPDNGDPV
ncbi:class I SAM-dependent methyltransferase [Microvirga pudoricolor]|uniref:class I SAM-dependent methyltransferase n=1 Tax=Microvirga pudoricolor TaxID=2778729 RepID=UPI00194DFB06|nr:methyltransferase domain-containing protein [Microvirga pudoricolor]MBM6592442.1 methyltransferase domain-containing protein [Microvirga pudoricolor]